MCDVAVLKFSATVFCWIHGAIVHCFPFLIVTDEINKWNISSLHTSTDLTAPQRIPRSQMGKLEAKDWWFPYVLYKFHIELDSLCSVIRSEYSQEYRNFDTSERAQIFCNLDMVYLLSMMASAWCYPHKSCWVIELNHLSKRSPVLPIYNNFSRIYISFESEVDPNKTIWMR